MKLAGREFRFRPWRTAFLTIALVLFAAWFVPQVSAERFRASIHQALEQALGRRVEMGSVKFRLLPAPGFTVENVEIGEDPAIGTEPAAYVTTLRAVPRLSALFGGPLAFHSMDLEETSLNLTRVERDGTGVKWNFSSLLRPALLETFPSVHMHGGRINFKMGDTKSVFYLLNTDVDLWPPSSVDAPWTFRIRTEPARTDRSAQGFGSFVGRGEWQQRTGSATLDVKLEKSQFGQMLMLFAGHDTGIRGVVSGEAHLAGPVNKLGVRARLALADLHSWEIAPPGQGAWPISVSGAIDIPGQTIDLRATTDQAPIDVRYRVANYLGRPRWGVMAYFAKLPVAPLLSIARNLGATIPRDMKLTGLIEGGVGFSTSGGPPELDGQIQATETTIGMPGTPALKMDLAQLNFSGGAANLAPAAVNNEQGETATLTGSYDFAGQKLDLGISSEGMEIASLRKQISVAGAPVLGQATSGVWSGMLRYSSLPLGWTGNLHLQNADIPFEAFSEPVHIVQADASIEGASLSLKKLDVKMGGLEASGEYRYEVGAPRPHRFRLTMAEADGLALEALLLPALRRGNLFTYAFNFGRVPQPDWLRDMKADGTLQMGTLKLMDVALTKVRSRVVWDGSLVKFAGLQGSMDRASFAGAATVDLGQRKPSYRVAGSLAGMVWRSGTIAAEGEVETNGLGQELAANLRASGSFHGKTLDFSPFEVYSIADGCFEWVWDARNPRLKLTQLALTSGDATFVGSGETQEDGQVLLKLTDGAKQIQAAGSIWRGVGLKGVGLKGVGQ